MIRNLLLRAPTDSAHFIEASTSTLVSRKSWFTITYKLVPTFLLFLNSDVS